MPPGYGLPRIRKGKRLTPRQQEIFNNRVIKAYKEEATIRDIVEETGRSYGFIHGIIDKSPEVQMRQRGGAHHRLGRRRKAQRADTDISHTTPEATP